MTDTLRSEGIALSMFAFGEYPQAYTPSDMMPNHANADTSAKLTQDARFEMGNRKTKIRISRGL